MPRNSLRLTRAVCGALIVFSCSAVGCGTEVSPAEPDPVAASESPADSEAPADAEAVEAAEATVRAFFAVKSQAEEPLSAKIDRQAVYLTSRDAHPSAPYEAGQEGRPSGISDSEVTVDLSNVRWLDDDIQIDFDFDGTGLSYPMIGDELQTDQATAQRSRWEGTATLENRNGEWLIRELSVDSFGGGIG
ncbi:hypothetical protein [Nocardioides campestrisoli]|uniref:hypothetical protein n=1 Tax=Nocardioides campestrisoli TaxID=2736757 RepID=UPI00163D9250|nr:hypothetical protein [Nocardioides campestrisoli]